MRTSRIVLAAVFAGSAIAGAQPASDPQALPKVIAIGREEIKPGRMSAHDKVNASFVAAISKTKSETYWLGLMPVSGDDNSVLFLTGYDSFAAVEADRKQTDEIMATAAVKAEMDQLDRQSGDLHLTQKTTFARYRPDLSFRAPQTRDVAQARFMSVTTVRVKPGRIAEYAEYAKAYNAAREKANVAQRFAVYQSVTGAPTGTFYVFSAEPSLEFLDKEWRTAIDGAVNPDDLKKLRHLASEIIAYNESAVFAMSPKISRPSPQFVADDPGFWKPKIETKALALKKEVKPASAEPPKQ